MVTPSPGAALLFHAGRVVARSLPEMRGKWRLERLLRRLSRDMVLPAETVLRTADGFRIALHPADYLQREVYLFGRWALPVARRMRSLLLPGDVAIDVGANVGYLTLHAARLVGPSGRVLAFEPNPACYAQLQTNLALNRFTQVDAFLMALGDHQGSVELHPAGGDNSGAGSLIQRPSSAPPITVTIDTLDAVLARQSDPPNRIALIKIDVEGFEVQAIAGMARLLSGPNGPAAVICEVSEWSLEQSGTSPAALFHIMRGHGYEHEVISPPSRSIFSVDRDYFQYDVLFRKHL